MSLAVVPLIPLIWGGVALVAGGSGGYVIWYWDRPPYKEPEVAYEKYVKAVEKADYKLFQWAVAVEDDPAKRERREANFKLRCDQRKKLNLPPMVEGLGNKKIFENNTKIEADALSPWDRTKTTITFRKSGDSWQVVE